MWYIHLHTVMYQEYGNVWWFHALCGQVILQLCPGTTGALWPARRITSPCQADQNVGWKPRDTFWQKSKSLGLGYVIVFHIYPYISAIYIYIYNYIILYTNMVVDQKSFIRKRSFFTNIFSCASLSQAQCLFFADRVLSNSSSYADSFITCQITQNYHG